MEYDNKFRKKYAKYSDYVQGNAVRKLNTVELPAKEPRTYRDGRRITESRTTLRNRERAMGMSAGYVMLLAVCSVMILLMCVNYLKLLEQNASKKADIAKTEMNIQTVKAQNDSVDYTINSYMDIDYISTVATQELGMVQASSDQISFYKPSQSEFMKQLKEIPKK